MKHVQVSTFRKYSLFQFYVGGFSRGTGEFHVNTAYPVLHWRLKGTTQKLSAQSVSHSAELYELVDSTAKYSIPQVYTAVQTRWWWGI